MLVLPQTVFAKAPVWKISRDQKVLYLGGTIHLLSSTDYPLPRAFEMAYQQADSVWFETDLTALTSPDQEAGLLSLMMYQQGQTLSSELNPSAYRALELFLSEREMTIAALETVSPVGLMSTLMHLELQRLGLVDGSPGVDFHFDGRALKDSKPRYALESIEAHLNFVQEINQLNPNLLVVSLLDELNELPSIWRDLLLAWRKGDLAELAALGVAPMQADYPSLYATLLLQRNNNWISQIPGMMQTPEVEFVLVGALHMAGEQGLIEQLQELGYAVEQLD